jgi:ADP-heptose:LPS heptosyltransferase
MAEGYKNILIIKPSSLGDVVQALPALSALRRNFPDAKISWLVNDDFAGLLKGHPHLDEIIPFERRFFGRAWYNPRAFAALVAFVRRLHRSEFDLVIDLQGLFRTAALSRLTGCKKRFGQADAREFAPVFYTDKIVQDKNCIHLVDYYLKIVKAAGASDNEPRWVEFILPRNSAVDNSIADLLNGSNINPANYAVFIPGSAHSDKRWPVECFAELAGRISLQFGFSIVAAGTAGEKDIVEQIKKLASVPVPNEASQEVKLRDVPKGSGCRPFGTEARPLEAASFGITNFAGATDIGELTALLRGARLVVSNDTGPGHIAAALGVPLVMIFGRANPARIAPYKRSHCVAAVEPDGRGFKANSADPKYSVKFITVDEVYQKVCEQLNRDSSLGACCS